MMHLWDALLWAPSIVCFRDKYPVILMPPSSAAFAVALPKKKGKQFSLKTSNSLNHVFNSNILHPYIDVVEKKQRLAINQLLHAVPAML